MRSRRTAPSIGMACFCHSSSTAFPASAFPESSRGKPSFMTFPRCDRAEPIGGTVTRDCRNRDRKSTRRTPVTNAHLVCRLLLEKKNNEKQRKETTDEITENQKQKHA